MSGAGPVHAGRGGVLPRRGGAGAGWLGGPPAALQGRAAGTAPPPARLLLQRHEHVPPLTPLLLNTKSFDDSHLLIFNHVFTVLNDVPLLCCCSQT